MTRWNNHPRHHTDGIDGHDDHLVLWGRVVVVVTVVHGRENKSINTPSTV